MHSWHPNYVSCDVSKFSQVERLFAEHDFDYVYHAAAAYGRWNGEDYYENLWATNAVGELISKERLEKEGKALSFYEKVEMILGYKQKTKLKLG
jgi:dTDP-glucose 4,6-dehydratase